MAALALAPANLTLVSLFADAPSPVLSRLLQARGFRDPHPIAVQAGTAAQRNLLASRIDTAITGADRMVLLVAEGAGCLAAAWWARLSPQAYVARVAGALLLAPDIRRAGSPDYAAPRLALPFPSVVVGADDTSQRLAGEWGSRLIDGPLPLAQRETSRRFQSIIARFTSAIVEHDVRAAERLLATIGDR